MNWDPIITGAVTITGWYVLYVISKDRDLKNKEKEIRINYLIEVWRKLNHILNRNEIKPENINEVIQALEQVTTDIQLLGTSKQISLVRDFLYNLNEYKTKNVNLDDLLSELRHDLREKLGLEKIDGKVIFPRFTPHFVKQV